MIRPRQFLALSLACAIAVAATGCAGPVNHSVADGIKSALPQVIGPAQEWDVAVTGNPGTIIRGRIPGVVIHGRDVQASPQITIASLDIKAADVVVDVRRRALKSIGSLTFAGVLTQPNLNDYLAATAPAAHGRPDNLAITLNDHDLLLSFDQKVSSFKIPVRVAGGLAVSSKGDDKIDFEPTNLKVASLPIPRSIVLYAARAINPAIDLSSLSFRVHLAGIRVDSRRVLFAGAAEVPDSAFRVAQQASNAR